MNFDGRLAVLPQKHQAHLFFPAHNETIVFAHFWNHEWTIFQKQYTTAQCTLFIIKIVSAKTAYLKVSHCCAINPPKN